MTPPAGLALITVVLIVLSLIIIFCIMETPAQDHHTGFMSHRSYNLDENGDIIDDSP